MVAPRTLDDTRADLLGLDKPRETLTDRQRALQRIVLARPRRFEFDPDRRDFAELERAQLEYSDAQAEWFLARTVDELLDVADRLIRLERRLSQAAERNVLAGRVGPVPL